MNKRPWGYGEPFTSSSPFAFFAFFREKFLQKEAKVAKRGKGLKTGGEMFFEFRLLRVRII